MIKTLLMSANVFQVFREPKKASQADSVLSEYSACIKVGTILVTAILTY